MLYGVDQRTCMVWCAERTDNMLWGEHVDHSVGGGPAQKRINTKRASALPIAMGLAEGGKGNNQALIRDHMVLPYLLGDFHPSHIQEYAGGLLLAFEKPAKDGGGIRPIICGESWRRCFASLAANAVRGPISRIFTSTYEFFYKLQVSRKAPPLRQDSFFHVRPTRL